MTVRDNHLGLTESSGDQRHYKNGATPKSQMSRKIKKYEMKNTLFILIQIIFITTLFSCKTNEDKFIGTWIICNDPVIKFSIAKKENLYIMHAEGAKNEMVLEKVADDVISFSNVPSNGGIKATFVYDKATNHLVADQVIDHIQTRQELCKSEN